MNDKQSGGNDDGSWDLPLVEDDLSWEWEARLRPQVRNVELLGEIPITAEECEQLGGAIAPTVDEWGHGRGLRRLVAYRPSVLAVYLVAQGLYSYQGGDYWSEVVRRTHFRGARTASVGQAFEEILERLKLELFYDMRAEGASRYVSLILAHGGIPTYCLPDFFANALQPAVVHAKYADMSAAELIDEWRWQSRTQSFSDKPVLRFLVYGGRVAEDFVDRCREMVLGYLDTGILPRADDVGLPERVVSAYSEWIVQQDEGQVKRETADRWRLHRPEIRVDPWGVFLDLPAQQVPATAIYAAFAWRVVTGSGAITVPVRLQRVGFDLTTSAESVRLGQPLEEYEAAFLVDNEVKLTSHFQLIAADRPLFVFDAEQGSAQMWPYSLPARTLGLVYPRDCELHVEPAEPQLTETVGIDGIAVGGPRLREELPRMPGGWAAFRGQVWDLTQASSLRLVRGGAEILTVTVRPDEAILRPYLTGGEKLSVGPGDAGIPVYVGAPPTVRVPLAGRGSVEEELRRWRLTVNNKWAAMPGCKVDTTLDGLRTHTVPDSGYIDLPLGSPDILGLSPMGNYTVRLRGPLGHGDEFSLRIVPHLVICGHEELLLPHVTEGHRPTSLLVETAPGDSIECHGFTVAGEESPACQAHTGEKCATGWEYEIEVGPDVSGVEMTVVRAYAEGDAVRVPVRVPVRRLRWAWADEQEGLMRRVWTGRAIRQSVEALVQAQAPSLLVSLPLGDFEQVRMALRLLDIEGRELQIQSIRKSPLGHALWRGELSAFLDTIRVSSSPALRLELAVTGLPGVDAPLRWDVVTLTQSLIVEDVRVSGEIKGDTIDLAIGWKEDVPLRNRRLRLWSLWRPWQPVYEQPIPDGADGALHLSVPTTRLAPGAYRLQFLVVDPWSTEDEMQRPDEDATGTVDLALNLPSDRQAWLTRQIAKSTNPFALLLERAYVRAAMNDMAGSLADQQQCLDRLEEGAIPLVLAFHDLAIETMTENELKALELKMFTPARVERLLILHDRGDLGAEHFETYLSYIPRSELLPRATCRLLVTTDDERARLYSAQQLVARSDEEGPSTILGWVREARISDADAVALLRANATFSLDRLDDLPPDPIVLRLYEKLAQVTGGETRLVKLGIWVRCDAGWGCIDHIEDENGAFVEQCIRGRDQYRLYVTLRPDYDAEPVVIDLMRKVITFLNTRILYTCTECRAFSARSIELIREEHNRAAHSGIGPRFQSEREPLRYLRRLEYSVQKPRNELA